MFRILRAFTWLRWRMFINSLERTGSRDMLERFSLAIEKLGPILAGIMLIPSALVLASLGAASGYSLALGDLHSFFTLAPRFVLMVVPVLCVIGPLLLPAADRTNPVRILLLPISRGTLYVAQSSAVLGDIWILLTLPLIGCIPLGLLAGGAPGAALTALAAAVILLLVLVALSTLTTSLVHLAVRDRRRGELLALVFIIIIPILSMLPYVLAGGSRGYSGPRGARSNPVPVSAPPWVAAVARGAGAVYPTELYTRATRAAAAAHPAAAARSVGGLALSALLLNIFGAYLFGAVLASPGSARSRREVPMRAAWGWRLPGLSAGASAVALAQLLLALRTPRGRAILLSPLAVAFMYFALNRGNVVGYHFFRGLAADAGIVMACFACFICSLSILPIALNQFAIDKAGLTRVLLSPLSDHDYLAGKAAGNALIIALPTLVCIVAAFALLPGTRTVASWAAIPVALLSVYSLVAPAAAAFSAMFPRVVDLNSIGRASNAHGVSGVLGILTFVVAGALTLGIAAAATYWFRRPFVTLLILVAWCAVCVLTGRLLFVPARRIFARRRENLAML
jgi:hypothetical protein